MNYDDTSVKLFFAAMTSILVLAPVHASDVYEDTVRINEEKQTERPSRLYRSPEERRKAGIGTEITDWLTFYGLLEIEKVNTRKHFRQNYEVADDEPSTSTLQLGFDVEYAEWLEIELILESEYARHLHQDSDTYQHDIHSKVDEAQVGIDIGNVGLKFGRLYVPFGEYYSYFIVGPTLEFGETRNDAVMVDYSFAENFEVTVFAFESNAHKFNSDNDYDWGWSFELLLNNESIRFGASYLSDLAESEKKLLEDTDNLYLRQVPAWSAYALLGFEHFEITVETVQALESFKELDEIADKPSSTNLEFAYFPSQTMQFAFRLAHSKELKDASQWQHGATATWWLGKRLSYSFDYLYGTYKDGFVVDDEDRELNHEHQIAVRMAVEF